MKNNSEPTQEFHEFIKNHALEDVQRLYMSVHGKEYGFDTGYAICQIECRRKTSRKLSKWLREERFLFPCSEVAEQSTHQCVASYHAMLAGSGKKILDITAGLGIDAFTMAEAGNKVTAYELDSGRAKTLRHNAEILSLDVEVREGDSIKYLATQQKYDIIFADPARRDADRNRLYFLRDCLPDIVTNLPILAAHASCIMIKASPIVDLNNALKELGCVTEIHIVCVKGECKEVLLCCASKKRESSRTGKKSVAGNDDVKVTVVDLEETEDASVQFRSRFDMMMEESANPQTYADIADMRPGSYLYDPNAGVHKLNCGEKLCAAYNGLKKLAPNTDLYVSEKLHEGFPGRIFRIVGLPGRKELKEMKGEACEVAVRNYTLRAEELRRKVGLKSGGDKFLFGCKVGLRQVPILPLCEKISNVSR